MLVLKVLLILSTIHTRTIFTYNIHNVSYDCLGLIYTTRRRSVGKSWRMLVAHNSRKQTSYRLNRPWCIQQTQRSDHFIRGSLGRSWKQWKILKPSSQKAVAVVFESFQQYGFDWEIVVFWIGGLLRKVVRALTRVDCTWRLNCI